MPWHARDLLMAMLCYVYHQRLLPSEEKVSSTSSKRHGEAKPYVVRHKNQHQKVGYDGLNYVEYGLPSVQHAKHLDSAKDKLNVH